MKILAHTSFIGHTGYANHAKSFFCALNKYHTVKVRNLTIGGSWNGYNDTPHDGEPYMTDEIKDMLIQQTLFNSDNTRTDFPIYGYDGNYRPDVHIILAETNNHYFYDNYDGYKIAYNVWESTRYPDGFFQRLFYFDEVWVPTQWQFDSLVEQGYPKEKISIVPEGVDIDTFKPLKKFPKKDKFRFLHFGRWDYRKGTTEVLRAFSEEFSGHTDVELIASVENPYPYDGLKTTEERVEFHKIDTSNIKFIKFTPREDYIKYLQEGDVFVSCARSEGWNLPLIEAMSCGTPSIYSDWGGQLEFAQNKGIPVVIDKLRPANIEHKDFPGEYCEPDWNDLKFKLRQAYDYHTAILITARNEAKDIHKRFNWDTVAKGASDLLENRFNDFAFVTTGNVGYMPVIEKLVQSLMEFSKRKIIVYGIDCEVPFDYPNVIKRTIETPKISEHDKWYWKQYACIESVKEGYKNYVWMDGDVVVNYNVDTITKYFTNIKNYPLSDIHVQEEFFGTYHNGKSQLFNEELAKEWGIQKCQPYMHVCMFVFNSECKWWFEETIQHYIDIMDKNPDDYKRLFLWNDEGIDNAMRWKYGYKDHLPLLNFDTSSYDGDDGFIDNTLHQFYKYWNEEGPQNFDRIFGYQAIPKDKNQIIYFHGNKNAEISDKMVDFIKMKRDNSFYKNEQFYTSLDVNTYKLENLGDIKGYEGSTMDVAAKFGWARAIYHEIFNLYDYYKDRNVKQIHEGDTVVDLGGNLGIFNRWAYTQGASKVISFEPDRRYFRLLSLNADPRSILFNAAVSHEMGELNLYESDHLGGSNVFGYQDKEGYSVRTYTLDYLFESGLVDKIDFLKVDIEGAEHAAFTGISDENLGKVKTIAMEYHHSHFNHDEQLRTDFIQRLNRLGFNSYLLFLGGNGNLQMIYFSR
jgi:FkbM family methyltransferase